MPEIIQQEDSRWTAVHTRPRCEKIVAKYCCRHNINHYLPLRRRAKRYQRRTVETFLPLFPGYVFVQVSAEQRSVVMHSGRVAALLPTDDASEIRLIEELRTIQAMENATLAAELVVQPELVPGKPVLITKGPLQGTNGIVERRHHKTRVTVNVDLLGQSVSVDLDMEEVNAEDE
ncbi:MAG: hypothetical protein K9N51_12060 [Candidatus Pacebacteria bacterium]|nr:hypothetical protein [Candidatus Paceibacterota bacterium]